ncbi:MAG: replication initiator protein [Microvirus sp.]|nr:MAG: replication initiator protein [Microvirus sp.]
MGCHSPMNAYRSLDHGGVSLREPLDRDSNGYEFLRLPCGTCLGCRASRARDWAFRLRLELTDHDRACFITLTYGLDAPFTLSKRDLALFFKRFRVGLHPRRIRFFGCGEYGEQNRRPHYHAIVFGASVNDRSAIATAWPHGFVRVDPVTPARLKYVAGYTTKKSGMPSAREFVQEHVDDYGEVHRVLFQPPFLQMSRNPGIGSTARQFTKSWRLHAVDNGVSIPVPRYLHDAWVKTSSPEQIEELKNYKNNLPRPLLDKQALHALKLAAETRREHSTSKRSL